MYALSRLFEERDGIFSPSNICASECLRETAAQGHLLAHVKVAMLPFWKRSISFDRNEIASLRFAVNSSNPLALNILGFLHQYGMGVEKNIRLALEHYNKAKNGCLIAKYNLAYIYFFGLSDVTKDERLALTYVSEIHRTLSPITNENQLKAFAYSRSSTEPFGIHALYAHIIGAMYHYGWGYPQDSRQAMIWLRLAADAGYTPAQTSLTNIQNTGCSIQ